MQHHYAWNKVAVPNIILFFCYLMYCKPILFITFVLRNYYFFNDGVKTHRHLYHLSQITAIVESNNKLVVLVSSGVKTPEDTFCSY